MNWDGVAQDVTALGAPVIGGLLGTALAGPAGGVVGQKIGAIVAEALGVQPTPQAVRDALVAEPDKARLELSRLEELYRSRLDAEKDMTREINTSLRAELVSGFWWQRAWRPLNGFVLAISCAWLLGSACVAIFTGYSGDATAVLEAALPVIAILGAVCGVTAFGRSLEKHAWLTQRP